MTKAWDMRIPQGQKMLLLALCDHANDDGACYPSQDSLAQRCSMSKRAIVSHIQWLEQHGILQRERRQKTNVRQSNLYQICLDNFRLPESESANSTCANSACANSACAKSAPPKVQKMSSASANSALSYKEEPSINRHIEPSESERTHAKRKKPNQHEADLQLLTDCDVPLQIAKDHLAMRKAKRLPLTPTALQKMSDDAAACGLTLAQALEVAIGYGWASFRADWFHDRQGFSGSLNAPSGVRPNCITQIPKHEPMVQKSTLARDVFAEFEREKPAPTIKNILDTEIDF